MTDQRRIDTLFEGPHGWSARLDVNAGWSFVSRGADVPGAAVLVMDSADRVLLLQIPRPPVGRSLFEAPRGSLEPGETAAKGAAREAREETGLPISERMLVDLGIVHPDSGILAYGVALFATKLHHTFGEIIYDEDEAEGYVILEWSELEARIAAGEITDAMTLACVLRWKLATAGQREIKRVRILDAKNRTVAEIRSDSPKDAFDAFCAGRATDGWTWIALPA